jgi:F420-non-reducing hydrogenase large subunit
MTQRKISIDPVTRLEGHGKIEIFLDDDGGVRDCFLQIPELRGFERFVVGRPIEELPRIVTRICGVCPASHHMASAKAVDGCFGGEVAPLAHKLRDMYYQAHYIHSHIAHFYALAAPDFVCGPDSDPAIRNILGVVAKVGLEVGGKVIGARAMAQRIQQLIGGRTTHLVWCLPGGVSKGITREELGEIRPMVSELYDFAQFSLQLFRDVVLGNPEYVETILHGPYTLAVQQMGLVDENNAPNFYDGKVRVVDVNGKEICKYSPEEYYRHVAEHVEPWSYLKFPYLKERGWQGFVEGPESSIYCATPLSRLNVADRMATPKAQEAYEEMFSTIGQKPSQALLACHWARLVEMVQNAEVLRSYSYDLEITGDRFRVIPQGITGEGVGIVEAMRGTLTHHYTCDTRGICTSANLIVGTTNNNAPIHMLVKKVASATIRPGVEPSQGLLNRIEMAFRAFDPCFSCATHSLPGQMPLEVRIFKGERLVREWRRGLD